MLCLPSRAYLLALTFSRLPSRAYLLALTSGLVVICLGVPAQAQKPASSKPFSPQLSAVAEPWLATAVQTRQQVLAELAPKAALPPYDQVFPLLQKAQQELALTDPALHRAAVTDACDAVLLLMAKTNDPALAAKIFDGFLMAALRFALPDPARYDGRLLLLKTAVGVYGQAGLEDRQLAALRLLRREASGNANLQDWVSLQAAAVYAHRSQYGAAVDALNAVTTPGMMGPTASLPALEQKLKDQQEAQAQQVAPAKTIPAQVRHLKSVHKKRPSRR